MDDPKAKKNTVKKRDSWPVTAFFLTFGLALLFSFLSEITILGVPIVVAALTLLIIVFIGIAADIVGVAVTTENVTAFTAMASKKIKGARQAIHLVQNANRVANICNDVIGDICGVVSGAMCVAIVGRLISGASDAKAMVISIIASALLSAITVGGKAVGKQVALDHSHEIVFGVAKMIALVDKKESKNDRIQGA